MPTTGYDLSKNPQPRNLGTPVAEVEAGATAELILSTPRVAGAVAYKHQYTTDAAAALWHEITSSRATCKIANLALGQTYSLRIVAIGTNDQVATSNVVTKIAA